MKVTVIKPIVNHVKKRVCAYARVTTASDQQGDSLENQIKYYTNKISANPEYEFVDIFYDRGITGTTKDRPEFQRMINLCRDGKIDIIYTKSISRFARNTTIVLDVVREFKVLGIEVIFENENISTMSNDGELMLSILASLAEEESRSYSENIKWRIRKNYEKGIFQINTKRFLGYNKDKNGNLTINLYESLIVKRIFDEYLRGNGVTRIAKMLNKDNMLTVTGSKWHNSNVLKILKNEKYKGDVLMQKTYVTNHIDKKQKPNNGEVKQFYIEDNHPPIILKEDWDNVQLELKRRTETKNIVKNSDKYLKRYPLTGKLYCSKCGAVLLRRTKLNKKIMWQCKNYIRNGKVACTGTTIDDEVLDDIKELTIIKEVIINGKKHYNYSCKNK